MYKRSLRRRIQRRASLRKLLIEQFERRCLLAPLVLSAPDDGQPHALRLESDGANLRFLIDGSLDSTTPLAQVDDVAVFGTDGGDETLTIDFSSGAFSLNTIDFSGGVGGNDELQIVGDGIAQVSYTPSATTAGAGTAVVGGIPIAFSQLEPLTVSSVSSLTFVTPGSHDVLMIDSPAAGRNRISGTSDAVAFEAITFFDVQDVVVDAASNDGFSDNDSVSFFGDVVANGLMSFEIETGGGSDTVDASSSTFGISVNAGSGNDSIIGGAGNDSIDGGSGDDTLIGSAGDDFVADHDGNNLIFGGSGHDFFITSGGDDSINGGSGDDTIDSGDGSNHIVSGDGTDLVLAGLGNDTINAGGGGDDVLYAGGGNNLVLGGAGNAMISGGPENDTIFGGSGNETILGGGGDDTIVGGDGADSIDGGGEDDFLAGGGGPDSIFGGQGNDELSGGDGDDFLYGGAGIDTIQTGAGDDAVHELVGTGYDLSGDVRIHTYTVENTRDDSVPDGGLRDAIVNANNDGSIDADLLVIDFAIPTSDPNFVDDDPGSGGGGPIPDVWKISPASALPSINSSHSLIINGFTQSVTPLGSYTGFADGSNPLGPELVLDGSAAGGSAHGLTIRSNGVGVYGLNIRSFSANGLDVRGPDNVTLAGNFIGLNASGAAGAGNAGSGIYAEGTYDSLLIGGPTPAHRNVISGNATGISLGEGSSDVRVQGNYIGTNADGSAAVGNTGDGISVNYMNVQGIVTIGTDGDGLDDAAEGNLISGNAGDGVQLGPGWAAATVAGNFIGTDATGLQAVANTGHGVVVDRSAGNTIGGTTAVQRNIISGNGAQGIEITGSLATGNVVTGNYVGLGADGDTPLGNGGHGIRLFSNASGNTIGGATAIAGTGAGNVISGNYYSGVELGEYTDAGSNLVQGNIIGLNADGDTAIGNSPGSALGGIVIASSNNTITQNVISGNSGTGRKGIYLSSLNSHAHDNWIHGNLIGTDIDGAQALGNHDGIFLSAGAMNNLIGTNADGINDEAERNIISGNAGRGVVFHSVTATGNQLSGNYIGVDIDGTSSLGNGTDGVVVTSSDNLIGTGFTDPSGPVVLAPASDRTGRDQSTLVAGFDTLDDESLTNLFLSSDWNLANGDPVFGDRAALEFDLTTLPPGGPVSSATLSLSNAGWGGSLPIEVEVLGYSGDGAVDLGDLTAGTVVASGIEINGFRDAHLANIDVSSFLNQLISGGATHAGFVARLSSGPSQSLNLYSSTSASTADRPTLTVELAPAQIGAGNVISGNLRNGVLVTGADATSNVIAGNYIGTNVNGTQPLGNTQNGVRIDVGASGNLIGGDDAADGVVDGVVAARNVISGNAGSGVFLTGAATSGNVIAGNYIGTDATGTAALGNTTGVYIGGGTNNTIGGTDPGDGNLISGNNSNGIFLINTSEVPTGTSIQGNIIGLAADGDTVLPNSGSGVYAQSAQQTVIGGTDPKAGNVISGNAEQGVWIKLANATGNVIAGNFIGTDAGGTLDRGNALDGVRIENAGSNIVGGSTAAHRNLISGNDRDGVVLFGIAATGNTVSGNYVGTDAVGSGDLGNGGNGIFVTAGAGSNAIGGTTAAERNVISGNTQSGVLFESAGDGNIISGNFIGLSAAGTGGLGNALVGIRVQDTNNTVIGGTAAGAGNVISGNGHGIGIATVTGPATNGTLVQGNIIGLDYTGETWDIGNNGYGVFVDGALGTVTGTVIGGSNSTARNIISGNNAAGVLITGAGATENWISGNYIGTELDGDSATGTSGNNLGNQSGVVINGGASNNTVGTDGDGSADTSERNIISGNVGDGVQINGAGTDGNVVAGNFIGTNADGTSALGNASGGGAGLRIANGAQRNIVGTNGDGSSDVLEGNLISGNLHTGLVITDSGTADNVVAGNILGLNIDATAAVPNVDYGILVKQSASSNLIGTDSDGVSDALEGNIISGNGLAGVEIRQAGTTGNTVVGNSIYANGGLGIDLNGGPGATANDAADADSGPNDLQNYPVLSAAFSGPATKVVGAFESLASGDYRIDFYASTAADGSGHGEGERFLGSTTVTTDAAGHASVSAMVAATSVGEFITATATDAAGNTSEFSVAVASVAGPDAAGNALHFDGANDFVEIPDSPSLHSDRQLTVEGWFQVDEFDKTWQNVFWKGNAGDCTPGCENREYGLWVHSSGRLHFSSTPVDGIGISQHLLFPQWQVEAGQWYHFAAVIDADASFMGLYVDGELVGSRDYSSSGIRSTSGPLRFGANYEPQLRGREHLNGSLDEMRIWNVARTPEQIRASQHLQLTGTEPGLVGYWSFDEPANEPSVSDLSPSNNDGVFYSPNLSVPGAIAGTGDTAMDFDPAQLDFVELQDFAIPQSQISVAFWIKTAEINDTGLLSYAVDGSSNELLIYRSNNLTIHINGDQRFTNVAVNDGNWHHVVVTWQSSDGALQVYKDGALAYSGAMQAGVPVEAGGTLTLGQEQDSVGGGFAPNQAFDGSLDEVAIYDTILAAADVQAHYGAGTGGAGDYADTALGLAGTGTHGAPVLYWRLSESGGSQVADHSGNANHGVMGTHPRRELSAASIYTSLPQNPDEIALSVTTTADSGPGSLRQALLDAQSIPALNPTAIAFAIESTDPNAFDVGDTDPDPDAFTIRPTSALPAITRHNVRIDGRTQGDTNPFGPEIVLDGSLVASDGLVIRSNDNQVHGLALHSFGGSGIWIFDGSNNWIAGTFIGIDATGTTALGNSRYGIRLEQNAASNTIGTDGDGIDDDDERNVISANLRHGIELVGNDTRHNRIAGNFIGTDVTGMVDLGNGWSGIRVSRAQGTIIGTDGDGNADALEGNLISGNNEGIIVAGDRDQVWNLTTAESLISGALPRTVASGSISELDLRDLSGPAGNWGFDNRVPGGGGDDYAVLGTGSIEVAVAGFYSFGLGGDDGGRLRIDGTDVVVDDSVHGFREHFGTIYLTAGPHTFEWLGIERWFGAGWEVTVKAGTHTSGPANAANGWAVLGDPAAPVTLAPDTHIDLTAYYSLATNDVPTTIAGNLVGTNADGTAALGNNTHGIWLFDGVQHTQIGTDGDGISDAAEANIVSGNGQRGIWIMGGDTDHTVIAGNRVGTDVSGSYAIENGFEGILVSTQADNTLIGTDGDGIADAAERNVVSGNNRYGINLSDTSGSTVAGNFVGTDASGTVSVANGRSANGGIVLAGTSTGNVIGTDGDGSGDAAEGNLVSGNNGWNGMFVVGAGVTGNTIAGNFVGTDVTGTVALPNRGDGIEIKDDASYNRVGTNADGVSDVLERNLVSGNTGSGFRIWIQNGGSPRFNQIAGNHIGTDVWGTLAIGNTDGVRIFNGASENIIGTDGDGIGDALEGNIISGNRRSGVRIEGFGSNDNIVAGNWIGTGAGGAAPVANAGDGVFISGAIRTTVGGTTADTGNVISGNSGDGISVSGQAVDLRTLAVADQIIAGDVPATTASSTIPQADLRDPQDTAAAADWLFDHAVPGGGGAHYLFVATGELQVNTPGTFSLGMAADAGGRVRIDGQDVLFDDPANGFNRVFANVTLSAGFHDLEWLGFERFPTATFELSAAFGGGNIGPITAANGWKVLGDPTPLPEIELVGDLAVTAYYPGSAGGLTTIQGNRIGTSADGGAAIANAGAGVRIIDTARNQVGGSSFGSRNIISGNAGEGIVISGPEAFENAVQNNFIGTNAAGSGAVGNTGSGVFISGGATSSIIGTDGDGKSDGAEGNLISGNLGRGVHISGSGSDHNVVAGNLIGTDAGGSSALGNGDQWWYGGVVVDHGAQHNRIGTDADGTSDGLERNVISANPRGVVLDFTGTAFNTVAGNYIGTDAAGTAAIANTSHGIVVWQSSNNTIGGTSAVERNVISGNAESGIWVGGAGATANSIQGNFIGVDVTGAVALSNALHGISLVEEGNTVGGSVAGAGNVISGNRGDGILISGSDAHNNVVQGNHIGTSASGMLDVGNYGSGIRIDGASNNTIGGSVAAARNIVSGNDGSGVVVTGALAVGNTILGNFIGTNVSGISALGNASYGVLVESGATDTTVGGFTGTPGAGDGNVISGNQTGIGILGPATSDVAILGNLIGTNAAGTAAIGNAAAGVLVDDRPVNVVIGGDDAADGMLDGQVRGRNVISGTTGASQPLPMNGGPGPGVYSNQAGAGFIIQGNYVGTDVTGTAALPNARSGAVLTFSHDTVVVGGTTAGAANLLSGNNGYGLDVGTQLSGSVLAQGNLIGTNSSGNGSLANSSGGVILFGTSGTIIGGAAAGAGNTISGNNNLGIHVTGSANNLIEGNRIGTDLQGTVAVPNRNGILINDGGSHDNTIRRNVISGNTGYGIQLNNNQLSAAENNTVVGNLIGTTASGGAALPNTGDGIVIIDAVNNTIGGAAAADRNVISGNAGSGIKLQGAVDTVISGNYVGLDTSGTLPLGNGAYGISVSDASLRTRIGTDGDGVADTGERNIVSDNSVAGIRVAGAGTENTIIAGNYVGTSASGSAAVGIRQASGVVLEDGARLTRVGSDNGDVRERNVVVGTGQGSDTGVAIWAISGNASDNTIAGNYVGLNAAGNASIGVANAGIAVASANNLVEGNSVGAHLQFGVGVYGSTATSNTLRRNTIGTDATGTVAQGGNPLGGVLLFDGSIATPAVPGSPTGTVIGGAALSDGNVISGSSGPGVELLSAGISGTQIQGNFIGTDRAAALDLGNAAAGIHVAAGVIDTQIGSITAGLANSISFNSVGVVIEGSRTSVRGNAIFANDTLGIDLGGDGVTANDDDDADGGANGLQNFPELTSAISGALTNVRGQLEGTPSSTYAIDFYKSPALSDPSELAQGRRYLGTTTVTTGFDGLATIDFDIAAGTVEGETITAVATDADGNSSEFSVGVAVQLGAPITIDPNNLIMTEVLGDEGYGQPTSTFTEGRRLRLDGLFENAISTETHTIDIDWGDGSAATLLTVQPGVRGFAAEHVYDDDRPSGTAADDYMISVFVIDSSGSSGAASTLVTIQNEVPTFSQIALSSSDGQEGDTLTLDGVIVDGGNDAHQLVIDWGDGSATETIALPDGTPTFSIPHTFVDNTSNISVRLLDDDTGESTVEVAAGIVNVAPQPAITGTSVGFEGGHINLAGSATEPSSRDVVDLSWSVSSGGKPIASGTGSAISFMPEDQGTFLVSLTAADDDDGTATVTHTVSVANAAPEIDPTSVQLRDADGNIITQAIEGQPVRLTGDFSDPGTNDGHVVQVNWGDGTPTESVTLPRGATSFDIAHVFADDNPSGTSIDAYTVTLGLSDFDGGTDSITRSVDVANAAPNVIFADNGSDTATVRLRAVVNDPSSTDTFTYQWQVNGNPFPTDSTTDAIEFARPTEASGTVTVTVTDDDGGTTTASAVFVAGTDSPDDVSITRAADGRLSVSVTTNGSTTGQEIDEAAQIVIASGDGNDKIVIDSSLEIDLNIDPGAGDDEITTGNGNNTIDISDGDDTLNSGTGNDRILVSAFSDKTINDNGGVDTLDFSGVQQFGSTDDGVALDLTIDDGSLQQVRSDGTIRLRGIFENITGTAFRDKFTGNEVSNRFSGGSGEDTISGGSGEDSIEGGEGNDLIFSGTDTIDSSTSPDSIDGGNGNDLIFGGDGDDTIYSGSGSDSIEGGDGNDIIFGGYGDDTIESGSGDGTIEGGDGNDLIFGTALGRANLYGGTGDDTVTAGGGEDTIEGGDGNDLIFGGGTASRVFGGTGDDTITAGGGDESVEGGDGNDLIFGGAAVSVQLYGDLGDDTIVAGGSEDSIDGGDGNDLIFGGGSGSAQVYGGAGDDTINAGEGDESIDGGDGNDLIFGGVSRGSGLYGGTGDDTVISGGGEDSIDGGDGNDLIFGGGGGSAQVYGGLGDDTINSGSGDDSVDGGEGNDLIFGRGAPDVNLYGGTGDDTLVSGGGEESVDGGDGNDLIFGGGGGSARVYGGTGDDTINAGSGDDSVQGGEGNDLIFGRGATDVNLYGGVGDDTVYTSGGEDSVEGGDGNDMIFGGRGQTRLYGGSGDDTVTGGSGSETIDGGQGNDLIYGGSGDDTITAGEGSETIDGGSGNDLIYGGNDSDTLDGSTSDDTITGGDGNDLIYGGSGGQDTLDGGSGDDSIIGGDGNDVIYGGLGDDTLTSGSGTETIDGGEGNDLIYGGSSDTLSGSTSNDTITGGEGNDLIYGGSGGDDTLDGGSGDDTIVGGDGNDLIYGGEGDDSISGSTNDDDSLDGGSGNDLIFGRTDTNATLSADRLTISGVHAHFTNVEAGALYGNEGDNLLDASAATIPVKLVGGGGDDTLLGGTLGDVLQGDGGSDSLSGGSGDDIYLFDDASAGTKTIIESSAGGDDTLNFQSLSRGIDLDMSATAAQTVVAGLTLTLVGDIENAFGTDASDTLRGNSLNNKLLGYGGHDQLLGGDGDDVLQAGGTRQVFLDFDSATEAGDYAYSQQDRDAIQARMEQDYAPFDITFSQLPPGSGPYVTVLFNAAVTSVAGSGRILGGISDRIGWRELSGSGTVQVDVNGFFTSAQNKLPATEENYIALSSTIASHELGHTYGLRHHDAFGSPGSGIFAGTSETRFRPAYSGPTAADETRWHLSASPASVGTTLIDALGNPFFGEREALKLAFAESGVVTDELASAEKSVHTTDGGQTWLVQALGALAPLAVPNTIEQGVNAGATLVAAAETIVGSIDLVGGTSESDFYSFTGRPGDVVTIELMSQVLRHRISNPIDSLLRVYDSAGEVLSYYSSVTGAFNDDTFEPTDSILIDLELPDTSSGESETYFIEVDTFSFGIPEISEYLGSLDTSAFCAANAIHTACADTDTGDYELLIYRFDGTGTAVDISGDTLIGGAGGDTLVGNSGSETFLGFNADEDTISDNSPSPKIVNRAPELRPIAVQNGVEGTELSFTAAARDDDGDALSWRLEPVDGALYPAGASIDSATGLVTFDPPDDGHYRARVVVTETLSDGTTGQSDSREFVVNVVNADPTGSIDSTSTPLVEGTAITVGASATDPAGPNDTLTYTYTVTKDGAAFVSASGVNRTSFDFTPDDNASYVVTLIVADEDGGTSEPVEVTLDVANANPVPAISSVSTPRVEGTEIVVAGTATDPAGSNDVLSFSYEVRKDGVLIPIAVDADPATVRFTPDDDAQYEISLTVSDEDGGSATVTQTVAVNNADPVPRIVRVDSAGLEGQPVAVTASATDPAGVNDVLTYRYEVFKNGGTLFASGGGLDEVFFSFTPDDDGNYEIVLTVSDEDGGSADVSSGQLTIANVPPQIGPISVAPAAIPEGDAVTVKGKATDAGSADILTVTIAWGDGTSSAGVPVDANGDFTASHVYVDNPAAVSSGDYAITVTAADDEGAVSAPDSSLVVTVSNVAPSIDSITVDDSEANATGTVHFTADFSDVGVADTHAATVDWGDGSPAESAQLNESLGAGTISGTHVYAASGDYTVTITVTDPSGAPSQETFQVQVNRTGVFLVDGMLRIFGTPDADRVFVLRLFDDYKVYADFMTGDHWNRFPANDVNEILVQTHGGDDYVQLAVTVLEPSLIEVGAGRDIVLGGSGEDLIYGGDGDDHLSGRFGDDTVYGGAGNDKLWGSFGEDVLHGGAGDDHLWGNEGDDVLVGGTDNDQLHGSIGRDLVIGGDGADRLKGDTNDDILVGGTTAFDGNLEALALIMAEWTSERTYAERVSNIRAGNSDGNGTDERANGEVFLQVNATVFDDGDEDRMQGGSGLDWFFSLIDDVNEDDLKDDRWYEQVDQLFAEE